SFPEKPRPTQLRRKNGASRFSCHVHLQRGGRGFHRNPLSPERGGRERCKDEGSESAQKADADNGGGGQLRRLSHQSGDGQEADNRFHGGGRSRSVRAGR